MAAFAPPLPGLPGASPAPPAGISGLVSSVPQPLPQGPTPQQRMEDYMNQVRELHLTLDALAADHPEAAEDLNQAKNALTNSMSKVAAAGASPEVSMQPPVV